jgi:hypothetical protein
LQGTIPRFRRLSIRPEEKGQIMPYTVRLKRSAEKELDALPPRIYDKVIKAILALKKNPYPRNVKRLHGR